jgi:RNA-directed DNA polymerase
VVEDFDYANSGTELPPTMLACDLFAVLLVLLSRGLPLHTRCRNCGVRVNVCTIRARYNSRYLNVIERESLVPNLRALFGQPIRISIPPEFVDEAALLTYLGLAAPELKKIWYYRRRMYHRFSIAKGKNGLRRISAPDERLKFLQHKLAGKLAELYQPRKPVHGFVVQRSIKTNALAHLGRRFVVNIDLKDFFPTIKQNRVEGMLSSLGIDSRMAEIIAHICCNNRHLPQGAPSSPLLSNMICFRLDKELMTIAKESRCIYTRYADDITFSSHQPPNAIFETAPPSSGRFSTQLLSSRLRNAFEGNGFTVHPDKLHYADRHSRRIVTGIKINESLNVDRRYVRNIRAALYSVEKLGADEAEKKFHIEHKGKSSLSAFLQGKISFLAHIKGHADPVVRGITVRFNKLFPKRQIKVVPTKVEIRERAVWVIDDPEHYATAFFLKGVGLVTAAHNVEGVNEVLVLHPSKHSNTFKATVRKRDKHRDLAILDHHIPPTEYFELDPSLDAVKTGDVVTALGYPGWAPGDPLNVRPGVISALTVKSAVQLIEVTQKLTQGMSGGPLLDDKDRVAGIIHKGGPGEGRDFALHIKVLESWLKENQ